MVIAGYILLKAPRTTHRVRYLQSLRSKLSDTTPAFDILFHRRTPMEQEINHLVVQCGENHVHPLSQALLTILDGSGAGVYIPRFAFASMSTEKAIKLFENHDSYIKALRFIPLSPLINNLDTLRVEHFPDGTTMERTVRDWASTILSTDGTEPVHCDVVNGGYDQKSYLLMAPQHEVAVKVAFEEYRRRVFSFRQREERFRESIGPPPPVIYVDSKVLANLSMIEKLTATSENWQLSRTDQTVAEAVSRSDSSLSKESENLSVSGPSKASEKEPPEGGKAKMPQTPRESLLQQYQNRSTDNTTVSTSSNSASGRSRHSMLSTSSARFIELEARITRQQNEFDRKEKISSDRLSQIERQLHQFDEVESKLDTLKENLESKLDGSQQAQTAELHTMNGQILVVMEKQAGFGTSINIFSDKISLLMGLISDQKISETTDNTTKLRRPSPNVSPSTMAQHATTTSFSVVEPTLAAAQMPALANNRELIIREEDGSVSMKSLTSKTLSSTESGKYCSPEKKRQRPGSDAIAAQEKYDNDMRLEDEDMIIEEADCQSKTNTPTQQSLADITTDLESRYSTQNSPGGRPIL